MNTKTMMTLLAMTAGYASASTPLTFLATNGDQLYRASGGSVDTFTLSDRIIGMTADSAGNIVASSPGNASMVGLYDLNDPFGSPSLSFNMSTSGNGYTSLTYVAGELYGFFDGGQRIYNVGTGVDQGAIGVNNTTFGGSAYDGSTFFALGRDINNDSVSLYSVSGFGGTLSASLIGGTGINGDGMSLEYYDGVLYAAIQNIDNGHFELGSIDVTDGSFTFMQTLATSFSPDGDPTSLVVLPAPGSIMMLGLGGMLAARRRR